MNFGKRKQALDISFKFTFKFHAKKYIVSNLGFLK